MNKGKHRLLSFILCVRHLNLNVILIILFTHRHFLLVEPFTSGMACCKCVVSCISLISTGMNLPTLQEIVHNTSSGIAFQLCWLETLVLERVIYFQDSPEMSSTSKARVQLEWNSPQGKLIPSSMVVRSSVILGRVDQIFETRHWLVVLLNQDMVLCLKLGIVDPPVE